MKFRTFLATDGVMWGTTKEQEMNYCRPSGRTLYFSA